MTIVSPELEVPASRAPASAPAERGSPVDRVALFLIGVGVLLRLARLFPQRGLWLDEAMLALNIVKRSFVGLMQPLDMNQAAPPGFLLAEKLSTVLFSPAPWGLRLPPLVVSVLSVPVFYLVAARVLGRPGARLALLMFALSDPLVYYATEVKQYAFDVLAVLLVTHLVMTRWGDLSRWGAAVGAAIVGATMVWFSHASFFALAGGGVVLLVDQLRRPKGERALPGLVLAGGAWVASFGVQYVTITRHISKNEYLNNFWAADFAPIPVSMKAIMWYVQTPLLTLRRVVGEPRLAPEVGTVLTGLMLFLALLGVVQFYRTRKLHIVGATIAMTLVASLLGFYPFRGRLILFMSPLAILFVGAGMDALVGAVRTGLVPRVAGAALCLPLAAVALDGLLRPSPAREDARPLVAHLAKHARAGDTLFLSEYILPPYLYHAEHDPARPAVPPLTVFPNNAPLWSATEHPLFELRRERVWLAFGDSRLATSVDEPIDRVPRTLMDALGGRKLDEVQAMGASLYLYDLSGLPPGPLGRPATQATTRATTQAVK